jgi:hypothetical protein
MRQLIAHRIKFLTSDDEDIFFSWLDKINIVSNVVGKGHNILIELHDRNIEDNDLINLIAIFMRYNVNMRQLSMLASNNNKHWFMCPKKLWYRAIFGLNSKYLLEKIKYFIIKIR